MQRILIADDSRRLVRAVRSVFDTGSYSFVEKRLKDAAAAAAWDHPDLVVINADTLDGATRLFSRLSQNDKTADIPVLLLRSCNGVEEGPARCNTGGSVPIPSFSAAQRYLTFTELSESVRRMQQILESKEQEMLETLESAAVIQQSLLPSLSPNISSYDFAWKFIPWQQVGGDLFNVFKLDETHIGCYIFDVSGRGVSAAMVATAIAHTLDPYTGQILKKMMNSPPYYELASPAAVLKQLNHEYPMERFGKFFTMCYLVMDISTGSVRYSNAGHPWPILLRRDGEVVHLSEGGPIIGVGEGETYEEAEIRMEHGDKLFLYTDGITEYGNGNDCFGSDRLVAELQRSTGRTLKEFCEEVLDAVMRFGNSHDPDDDMTLLGIEYTPGTSLH